MTANEDAGSATVVKGSHYGWLLMLAGVALVAGGAFVAVYPGRTVRLVTLVAGVVLIVNGAFEVISALAGKRHAGGWGFYLASGIWSVAFGLPLVLIPELSARALAILLGIFLLLGGIIGIIAGGVLRSHSGGAGHFLVRGVIGVALGAVTVGWPSVTLTVIAVLFACWLILVGLMLISAGAGITRSDIVIAEG